MAAGNALLTNTPNFLGQLFNADKRKTQFMTLIGGLDGGNALITTNPEFPISVNYSIGAGAQPKISENDAMGALKPNFTARSQTKNVVEIHQSSVRISNLRQRAKGRLSGIATAGQEPEQNDELAFQLMAEIEKMKRDMNWTAINGTFADGGLTDSAVALSTRGILEAITTNVVSGPLDATNVSELVRLAWLNGDFERPMLFTNSKNRVEISKAFVIGGLTEVEADRYVGGVAVGKIVTEFGEVFIATDEDVPADIVLLADLNKVKPVFTLDDETGDIISVKPFETPGGRTLELYAEFGLDHGAEQNHAKLVVTPGV